MTMADAAARFYAGLGGATMEVDAMARLFGFLALIVVTCVGCGGASSSDARTSITDLASSVTSTAADDVETATDVGPDALPEAASAPTSEPAPAQVDPSAPLVDQATACIAASGGELTGDSLEGVTRCFDAIRARQDPLGSEERAGLRAACTERGGAACTELLLRSEDADDQLLGLACGGREPEIPCPESAPGTAAEAPPAQPEGSGQAATSPAQRVDEATRGNVVFYSLSEVDRPLYGWKDFATVAYCTDGRFVLESRGERRTVLDNTEYRSDRATGTWRTVDRPDGLVAVELSYDDGRRNAVLVQVTPSGSFVHERGVSAQLQGSAGC